LSLPLLVRPNTILPIGSRDDQPDYEFADGITLQEYEMGDGEKTVEIPSPTGEIAAKFTITRNLNQYTVVCEGTQNWQFLLGGLEDVISVEGGTGEDTPKGILATPHKNNYELRITF
jgi:alpha-D-xyloside xylohydrolase